MAAEPPSSPTAPTTSPPVAQSIAINLDVEDLTVGQTVTLTATVTLSDGSRRPVTDGAWESDNSDVAFLETTTGEEVLLRAVGAGSVLIHTGEADQLEAQGFLEEVFIHEATHTTLDARHASSSGWIQAQGNDMNFISTYARDHPMREDLAESFPMWMALRYREGRISSRLAATIRTRMPHRIAYLDDQNFDMAPVR